MKIKLFLIILFYIGVCKAQDISEIEMVFVKGGTFLMGCTDGNRECLSDEFPVHKVTLDDFYISKYEITQQQWEQIMEYNESEFKGENLPVENIIYDSIQSFIMRLNILTGKKFRLPTEAEWEYAARGGNKSKKKKYAGSNNVNDVAWYKDNGGEHTSPVGKKKPNELGIYDMSGNVWEFCEDWYVDYKDEEQINPRGPQENPDGFLFTRVLRGGSWRSYYAEECRVSRRDGGHIGASTPFWGFRVVMKP
jgi:formylglycine-generating enzyme required for sulfatase activity